MASFDQYAPGYKDKLQDPLRDRFARSAQFFIDQKARIVRGRLPAPSGSSLRLLDAGCGQGSAFAAFGEGVKVFGSDVSVPMLTEAVARGPVVAQEPYDLPFADSTFDGVYAFCIYHHIPDEDHVRHLSELRRVVAPGGEVMVFEHNPYNPVTARIFARAEVDRGCHMIAPSHLRATFRAAGFDEIDQGYCLFVPEGLQPVAGWLEPRLAWLPIGGQYFVAGRKSAAPR